MSFLKDLFFPCSPILYLGQLHNKVAQYGAWENRMLNWLRRPETQNHIGNNTICWFCLCLARNSKTEKEWKSGWKIHLYDKFAIPYAGHCNKKNKQIEFGCYWCENFEKEKK